MKVNPSKCLPYACNRIEIGKTDYCVLCHKQITDFHYLNYPVGAHGSDEIIQEKHNRFVVFDPTKVSCLDDPSGSHHRYAHAQCIKDYHITSRKSSLEQKNFKWIPESLCEKKQIQYGNAWLKNTMHIEHPESADENLKNFVFGLGDMGLLQENLFNYTAPSGAVYRTYKGENQIIEFVHMDKFYATSLNIEDDDVLKRFPLWTSYIHDNDKSESLRKKRILAFDNIYPDTEKRLYKISEGKKKVEKLLSVREHESLLVENFSSESILKQDQQQELMDTEHRWWDGDLTFRIILNSNEVGLIEFMIKENAGPCHARSLFLYNVVSFGYRLNLTPEFLWFSKHLAVWMNRFTDIRRNYQTQIQNVYLTTSHLNTAFETQSKPSGFIRKSNKNVFWNVYYYWRTPSSTKYEKGSDAFPTNIVSIQNRSSFDASLLSDILSNRNKNIEKNLMPPDSQIQQNIARSSSQKKKKTSFI